MLRDLLAIRRDPLRYLERVVARYGDLVAFPLPRTPVLLVNDPDGARRVLVENARGYSKQTVQYGALGAVTGAGLLTADGPEWRRHRRIAQPAFHHGSLDAVADQSARAAQHLLGQWRDLAPGAVVDVDAACLRATLDVVGGTLFDADLAADGARIVTAVGEALEVVVARARAPRPAWLPLPSKHRLDRAVATLDETCARVVRSRRARGIEPAASDLLALLLRSADPDADGQGGLTDREVRDEIVTLVIAGHETVASSLGWTLQLLAEHPAVQDRLHAELTQVLEGRRPGWSDVPALRYTRRVVDEALRLYPPAWVLTRRAVEADVVAGVDVPAGSLVIISPWLLHRRAEAWPDPAAFDPDRFAADRAAAPRPDYLPFGVGPRLCIGRDFALVESVLVLATLLQRVRFEPVRRDGAPTRPDVDALVTLRPHGGLPLHVQPR
ncbi:cytochrome P450 [Angustibacter luteus]|uniref:Cytochrome P450 n=1 Tax=Angustibacter luteus TaxID=658456 RepID=A0ABW1JIC2_9ACTN